MMTIRMRRALTVLVVAVAVAAAAVVALMLLGDDDPAEEAVLPLLGTTGEVPQRAALAVKIDNTDSGRPPTGLVEADVVFTEMVEGGLTRLLAVYHSEDPETVGPVRSARSTDLFILPELGRPLFAWSGANPTFAAAVEAADILDVGLAASPDAYRRDPGRPAPYNVYAETAQLREGAADDAGASTPPQPIFVYRDPDAPLSGPGVEQVTGFRTTDTGPLATQIVWEWDPDTEVWVRSQDGTPHTDSDDEQIQAANVIIQETPYRDSGLRDSAGAVVPEAEAVGEGDLWLLSDGQAIRGRWHKPAPDTATTYVDPDGEPLRLTPGRTWVELLPPDSGEVQR
jgi:hypothetical protein